MKGASAEVTAGLVLIGNEILTGKIRDENGPHLVDGLRRRGVDLCEIHVVADDVPAIVEAVNLTRARRTYCFTSGGIGPTHDDVTMAAVAAAFDVPLEERADLVRTVEAVFGGEGERTRAWRKMASVPVGCEMHTLPGHWPIYRVENVFILPGIPQIFRQQVDALLETLGASRVATNVAYFRLGEGDLARPLTELAEAYAGVVDIGSYPVLGIAEYQVKVTLDSRDEGALAEATARLMEVFPAEALHELAERVEHGEG